ncbi:MAG: hypothetical protein L3J83_03310 [Proteobacteria bacterium]|nr:hypothetical protein [Pseudomonadota bacterium]
MDVGKYQDDTRKIQLFRSRIFFFGQALIITTIQEIKSAIGSLPHQEYMQLLGWIHDKDWSEWDKRLDSDIASGKLNFLAKEAQEAKKNSKLREL